MIIYTSIVHKPPEIIMCDAYVTDFPLDLDIDPKDANKGTPEETGSYLVSKDLPKQCLYTRLSSLQKLKEQLIFTVCLSYQYSGLEDTVEEKQEVNVGKPLIAKLDMHRDLGGRRAFRRVSRPAARTRALQPPRGQWDTTAPLRTRSTVSTIHSSAPRAPSFLQMAVTAAGLKMLLFRVTTPTIILASSVEATCQ